MVVYDMVLVLLVTGWMRDGTFFGWCFKGRLGKEGSVWHLVLIC